MFYFGNPYHTCLNTYCLRVLIPACFFLNSFSYAFRSAGSASSTLTTLQTNANRFRCFISLCVGFLYTHSGALHAYVFPQLVGQGGIKRILNTLHLKRQPTPIASCRTLIQRSLRSCLTCLQTSSSKGVFCWCFITSFFAAKLLLLWHISVAYFSTFAPPCGEFLHTDTPTHKKLAQFRRTERGNSRNQSKVLGIWVLWFYYLLPTQIDQSSQRQRH